MVYLDIVVKSFTILALVTFMIISIWGFVVFNSICNQLKYTNYILEKISHILNISTNEIDFKKIQAKKSEKEDNYQSSDISADESSQEDGQSAEKNS